MSDTPDADNEVYNYRDINKQDHHFDCREVSRKLIHFQWNQATGRNDGEVFGPAFSEQQARAFREKKASVHKRPGAKRL